MQSSERADRVSAVRAFNRFYTRVIGALNEGIHASAMSLQQVRILYELAYGTNVTASDLARLTGMDAGYLSRTLKALEADGLVSKSPSPEDGRSLRLGLTAKGREIFGGIDRTSADEVGKLLAPLAADDQRRLVAAMQRIRRLLGESPPGGVCVLRDPRPGDLGWVVHRQGALYAAEYGWDWRFEALVAEIVGGFVKDFDPSGEKCWLAERDGEVVGSIFLMRQSDELAKLRLLYVEPSARGLGIGGQLVEECIRFARARGYKRMTLWTNDILVSARKIYIAAGFKLVEEEKHHSFGHDLVGQNWELTL